MQAGGVDAAGSPPVNRGQVLDELEVLATVEHALVVEYLTISYVLGPGPTSGDTAASAQRVSAAAVAARGLAEREMRHLHLVNQLLTRAGRLPELARAVSIRSRGSEIRLGPPTAAELERLPEREQAIASAVDERYGPICEALMSEDGLFICPDHVKPLADLLSPLEGLAPSEYLRVTRRDASDELERTLLELSDAHYGLIVSTVRASFQHEDELGNELLNRALTTMDVHDAINALLVNRGLLPAFTLPPAAADGTSDPR